MATINVQQEPFPAPSKFHSGLANNTLTNVTSLNFADKLLLTITQEPASSLSHWVHVPLAPAASADPSGMMSHFSSYWDGDSDRVDLSLLPRSDLTATTVLGGTRRDEEVVGQTLATTIASAILVKSPREQRMLVLGLGLRDATAMGSKGFEEVVGLVLDCL